MGFTARPDQIQQLEKRMATMNEELLSHKARIQHLENALRLASSSPSKRFSEEAINDILKGGDSPLPT